MNLIIRIILGVLLVGSSLLLLLFGAQYEAYYVEHYYNNWLFTTYLVRLVPLTSTFLGFSILFGIKNRFNVVLALFTLLFLCFDLFVFSRFTGQPIAFYYPHLPVWLVYLLSVMLFFCLFYYLIKFKFKKQKKWVLLVLVIAAIGFNFIRPIYIEDWKDYRPKDDAISNTDTKFVHEKAYHAEWDVDEPILIPFFTTTCPFCKSAAKRIAINKRLNKLPKTIFAFPGNKEDTEAFLGEVGLSGSDYVLLEHDRFLDICGSRFPSIFLVDQGKTYHWIGSEFNNFAMHRIKRASLK